MSCRYPYNLDFDFGALEGLNKFSINNLGDPFIESNYGVHSREFEVRCVVPAAAAAVKAVLTWDGTPPAGSTSIRPRNTDEHQS
jgi:hypothetical protein